MLARGFKEIQRAYGVHVEIHQGNVPRAVMRRLRGAVDHEVEAVLPEEGEHRLSGPDVYGMMLQPRDSQEMVAAPRCVAFFAEKLPAHVVVEPKDLVSQSIVMHDC